MSEGRSYKNRNTNVGVGVCVSDFGVYKGIFQARTKDEIISIVRN